MILKFWLNMSKAEQRKQLLERIDEPDKKWKFNPRDLDERALRGEVPRRLRAVLACDVAAVGAWYAVPADNKHYVRWQVAKLVNEAFGQLGVDFPRAGKERRAVLKKANARLLADRG